MRILTRYILGEVLSLTLIGCALFTFILFMPQLPHILEVVVRNSSTWSDVAEVFLFTLPNLFKVTIPMAVLWGLLLGLSRLAADSEIVAMRASGLGIGYFVRVSSILAIAGTLLGLANTLFVAPRANQAIIEMEQSLETSQASYEIQPRVFYEGFRNFVLYVQDVRSGTGAANWRQVFMADVTDPANPLITTAASATVVSDNTQELLMRLRDGLRDETVAGQPGQSNISTFTTTDMPLALGQQSDVHLGRVDTALYALSMSALMERIRETAGTPDQKRFLIEWHNRFSFPAACLVLMLVGVPLGAASRRGGKSSGFVFTILLVFVYYFLSSTGIALGHQSRLPAFLAVWSANLLFAAAGIFLLYQMASGGRVISTIATWASRMPKLKAPVAANGFQLKELISRIQPRAQRTKSRGIFPRILDEYIVREFVTMFFLVLAGFVLLMIIFTFFDLLGDILRNHIPLAVVGDYLLNLTPSMLYQIAPLAVLIAALVVFGVLNRNSEIVAIKATGISLYRLVIPIVSIAVCLAISLFLFDQYYLPQANRRQELLRNVIKGRPPQTYLHPEQKWIFGQPHAGERARIFYYQFFDPDLDKFANVSVFEFDPSTFALTRRIFASRAIWDDDAETWRFENGWVRDIASGAGVGNVTEYREFLKTSFPEIHEPPDYFQKEALESQEMNFGQLDRYIRDLRQSGFDTMRLRVALWQKLSYPLIAVVMAVLAVPFALSMGRRSSLTGVAVAIAVAITYRVVDSLFGAMGNVNYLPAGMAAWSADILFGLAGGYLLLTTPT